MQSNVVSANLQILIAAFAEPTTSINKNGSYEYATFGSRTKTIIVCTNTGVIALYRFCCCFHSYFHALLLLPFAGGQS